MNGIQEVGGSNPPSSTKKKKGLPGSGGLKNMTVYDNLTAMRAVPHSAAGRPLFPLSLPLSRAPSSASPWPSPGGQARGGCTCQRDGYGAVAQPLLDDLGMLPEEQEQGRMAVPHVVEAHVGRPARPQQALKLADEVAGVERPALLGAEDQTVVAVRGPPGQPLPGLPLFVGPEPGHHFLRQRYRPPRLLRLRLHERQLVPSPYQGAPHGDCTPLQVYVLPLEAEELAAAEACRPLKEERWEEPAVPRRGQEPVQLIGGQGSYLLTLLPRRADRLGHVAVDEVFSDRLLQGLTEHGVYVGHRPGREPPPCRPRGRPGETGRGNPAFKYFLGVLEKTCLCRI